MNAQDNRYHVGEWVEVLSKDEILKTLDKNGQLDRMPFMPQMFQYCGKRFKVYRSAHKTCDTVTLTGGRELPGAVHLEGIRCDGASYGGCQAGCLIFWKGEWLKRVDGNKVVHSPRPTAPRQTRTELCTEEDVIAGTRASTESGEEPRYVCQVTQLPAATQLLPWWKVSQYFEDHKTGNVTLRQLVVGMVYVSYYRLGQSGIGLGAILRWFYDRFQSLHGGIPYPRRTGVIPRGSATPKGTLDLVPGELVRVKPYKEILATLDSDNRNRGLLFDAEMVPFCGKTLRVHTRVNQILNERTGKLVKMKNDCIVLEGATCQGRYSDCHYTPMFCPRNIYSYWREIWLERVPIGDSQIDVRRESVPDLTLVN